MRRLNTKALTKRDALEVEELLKKYGWYVNQLASYVASISGVPVEDLKQEGFLGLVKARELYDKNISSFLTYAQYWIRLAVYTHAYYFQYPVAFPSNFYSVFSRFKTMKKLGMSEVNIAKELKLELRRLKKIINTVDSVKSAVRLDAVNDEGEPRDVPTEFNRLAELCKSHDDKLFMHKIKAIITEQELFVLDNLLALTCPQQKTLAWLGEVMGVTKERVRQIKKGALEKIRKALNL
jgi:RNA polymerase sigma factor (sigma-70 family)